MKKSWLEGARWAILDLEKNIKANCVVEEELEHERKAGMYNMRLRVLQEIAEELGKIERIKP